MVDATYRSDLRELNELNFARFDAKLEQRLAQLETRLTKRLFGFWIAQAATTAARGRERCLLELMLRHYRVERRDRLRQILTRRGIRRLHRRRRREIARLE